MNIALTLLNAARAFPHAPALSIGRRKKFDYQTLGRRAAGLAGGLQQFLDPGDRIVIASNNCPEYLELLYGAWHGGFAVAPLNARLNPAELAFAANDCGARAVFADEQIAPMLVPLMDEARIISIGGKTYARLVANPEASFVSRQAQDLAWIFYTSGTTGKPKGAMLTHGNLWAMTLAYFADIDFIHETDALLHFAATSHASGLFALSHIAKASNNILPESGGYDPEELASLAAETPNLTFFAPPTVLRRICANELLKNADLSNIKTVLVGAAPVFENDIRGALDLFGPKIWNGYGQGESPCTITAMSKKQIADAALSDDIERLVSVGVARTGVELKIDAETADGVGEVLVRGGAVMAGYWGDEAASRETLKDGWLHTGDLGRLDDRGYLTLLDRKKDMIISGGQNIYAREVEDVLSRHEGVADVAVIGVPDPEWGERVVAVISLKSPNAASDEALDAMCLEHIARFKRPRRYEYVDALPKNSSGKTLKAELRQRFR